MRNIIDVNDTTRSAIMGLVGDIHYDQTLRDQNEAAIAHLHRQASKLPEGIRSVLENFRDGQTAPWIVLSGMPTEKYSETLLLISKALGFPFAHAQEAELVCSVKPRKEAEGTNQTAFFTWNRFDLHTELPYLSAPPDYLILYCVHNVAGGFTITSSGQMAFDSLTSQDKALLQEGAYQIAIPKHFGHSESHAAARPVIYCDDSRLKRIRVRFDGIIGRTPAHETALANLKTALEQNIVEHELRPGEMLIINNRLATHGRRSFTPRFDGADRELRRVYIIENLEDFQGRYDKERRRATSF